MERAAMVLAAALMVFTLLPYGQVASNAQLIPGVQEIRDGDGIEETVTVYTVTQYRLAALGIGGNWRDKLIRGVYGFDIDHDGVEEGIVWGLRFIYVIDDGRVAASLTTSMLDRPSWYFDKPVIISMGDEPVVVVSIANVYDAQPRFYNPWVPGTGIRTTYSQIVFWRPFAGWIKSTRVFHNRVYLSRTAVYNPYNEMIYIAGADIYVYGLGQGIHRITMYIAELSPEGEVSWENAVYSDYTRVSRLNTYTSMGLSYYLYMRLIHADTKTTVLALFASGYTGYWMIRARHGQGVVSAVYVPLIPDNNVNMILLGSPGSIHVLGLSNIYVMTSPPLWKSYTRADSRLTDNEALIPMAYGYFTWYMVPSPLWDNILLRTERFVGYIYVKGLFTERPRSVERVIAGRVLSGGYVVQTIVSSAIYRGSNGTRIYMVLYCYKRSYDHRLYLVKYDPVTDTVEKQVWLGESVIHQVYIDVVGGRLALFTPGRIVFYDPVSLEPAASYIIGYPPPTRAVYSYIQVPVGGYRVKDRYVYVAQLYDRTRDYPNMQFMQMLPRVAGSSVAAIEIGFIRIRISVVPRIMLYGETLIRYTSTDAPPGAMARFTITGKRFIYNVSSGWIDIVEKPHGEASLSVPARGEAVLLMDVRLGIARYSYVENGYTYNPPDIYGGGQRPVIAYIIYTWSAEIYVPGIPVELEFRSPPGKLPPAAYAGPLPLEILYQENYHGYAALPPIPGISIVIYTDNEPVDKLVARKRISLGDSSYLFIEKIDPWFIEPKHTYVFEAMYPGDELREPAAVNHTVYAAGVLTRLAATLPSIAAAKDNVTITIHVYSSMDNATWREATGLDALLRIHVAGPYLDRAVEKNITTLPWSLTIPYIPRGTYRVEAVLRPSNPLYEEPEPVTATLYVEPLRPLLVLDKEISVGEPLTVSVEEEAPGTGVRRGVTTSYRLEVSGPGGGTLWSIEDVSPTITVPGTVFNTPGNYTIRVTLTDTGGERGIRADSPLSYYYEQTTVSAQVEVSPAARLVLTVKPEIDLGNGSTYTLTPVLITVETDPPVPGAYITVTVEDTNYTLRGGGAIEHVFRTPGAKRVVAVYRLRGYAAEAEKTIMVYPRPVAIDAGKPPYINHTLVRVVDYEGKDAAGTLIIRYSAHGVDASFAINYTGGEVTVDPRAIGIAAAPAEARLVHVETVFVGNGSYGNASRVFDILLLPGENSGPRPLPEPGTTPILILAAVLAASLLRRTASPGNRLPVHSDV